MTRKLVVFNMISLDGFFAGPNGELDWHVVDDEFNRFAEEQTPQWGGLVFGRVTYEMMAAYWPTEEGTRDDPVVAKAMNELPKLVASRTLKSVDWENSRLAHDDIEAQLAKLKQEDGNDLAIFGSANLIASLLPAGLIDEVRLMVSPVVLGQGKPLFLDVYEMLKFHLIDTRTFASGNVLLSYDMKPG